MNKATHPEFLRQETEKNLSLYPINKSKILIRLVSDSSFGVKMRFKKEVRRFCSPKSYSFGLEFQKKLF